MSEKEEKIKIKEKDFIKSLKKMLKKLNKLPLDDQAKMVKMLASYCGLVSRIE